MSMNSPHESVKDIVTSVWKSNRPLAIAVLIVAVIAGYVLYKRSQASIIAPAADVTPSATGLPGNIINNTYTTITKTVTGLPGAPGPPGPPGPPGQIKAPPPPTLTPPPGPPPVGVAGRDYGLIPFSFFPTGRFPTIPGSTTTNVKNFVYKGVNYIIHPAGQGKIYGTNPQGQTILLYEPISFYPGGPNYGK